MKLNNWTVIVALVGLFVVACGGSDSAGLGSLSESTATTYCEDVCDRELDCDPGTDWAGCVDGCLESGTVIRGDVFTDFHACVVALPCGTDEDVCYPTTLQPLPIHDQYQDACVTRFGECGVAQTDLEAFCGTDGNGDMAEMLPLLATDVTQAMIDCLDVACDDIPDCFDALLDL